MKNIEITLPKAKFIRAFNDKYHKLCQEYWDKSAFFTILYDSLTELDIPEPKRSETINRLAFDMSKTADGALRCWQLAEGVYLCITWHQMRSYKYEFVAYVS